MPYAAHHERTQLEALEEAIERAIQMLKEQIDAIDREHLESLIETAKRLAIRLDEDLPPSLDTASVAEIRGILIGALRELDKAGEDRPLDTLDDFLVRAESIRHIVRDALDEDLPCDTTSTRAIVKLVEEWLPRVTRTQLGQLFGVDGRSVQRWASGSVAPAPSRRVLLVARLVALLKDAWTPEGVVAWFERPRRELDAKRPLDVLDDPAYENRVLLAAREGRAQHGS